ncbi:tRNA (guanine-N(7)-)-methyltransferase non-catalytic subunit wuho [Diorhabda carinulata]|uniref:tRNA (guanine-N(7)-)-methyltransferase non-catalytic subunit wuho n=1 Tax=Diorhabda carinulata TaxID=1163345 RepID=UPI0025A19ECC|nr:tRNA (guanine-N(7)-)-methyltransferase non-catalytic subunit wuho [Diorhabda carinulata]
MVLLKKKGPEMYITYADNVIQYRYDISTDLHLKIPKPIIPKNLRDDQIKVLEREERNIISLEFSKTEDYILISTENKQILVYDKKFNIVKTFIVNRAPSIARFTPSDDILVADKTGDVYLYKLHDEKLEPILLLGHLSVILDIAISDCGKYLITSDRDEKIRVSHFPNCYNIASYCLGHTEFVNRLKILKDILISSSGDGTIRFWDFVRGKQLSLIDTNSFIQNENLLQNFSEEMIKEKVEIFALPIIDMQIYFDKIVYLAVSIYRYEFIQLYTVDISNFNSSLVSTLKVDIPFSFCLCNKLFVLSNKFSEYTLVNNVFEESNEPWLITLYDKYKDIIKFFNINDVSVLYKRKYDNVQDYMERKKQRL